MFCLIGKVRHCVLHAVDIGTSYSETAIFKTRSAAAMSSNLESIWLDRNGAPQTFARDYEFQSGPMKRFLSMHNIQLCERPVRRQNKSGVVERKHLTLKRILERLQFAETPAKLEEPSVHALLLNKATFLSNMFSGGRLLRSF